MAQNQEVKTVTCKDVQATILIVLELGQRAIPDSPEHVEHLQSCENCKHYAKSQVELRENYGDAMAGVNW